MKKLILSSLLLLCIQSAGLAQSTFGFHVDSWFPTGDLKNDSPELWGGGFSLEAVGQLKNSPVHVGAQIGWNRYGSELRNGYHGPGLGDIRLRRNNELANMLGIIRLKPNVTGNIQPYVDFVAGFTYVYTRAVYRDSGVQEPFREDTELRDFAFNYGVGGGLEIFLSDELSLDFRVRTVKGSRAEYLTSRSVTYNHEFEGYDMEIKQSNFDYLSFSIGIKAVLWSL